jgi:hypothetical protein
MLECLLAIVGTHRLIRSRSSCMFAQGSAKVGRIAKTSSKSHSFTHPLEKTIYSLQASKAGITRACRTHRRRRQLVFRFYHWPNCRFYAFQRESSFFSGIIAFLGSMKNRSESFTQVQQSAYSNWWIHLEAIRTILTQRGGLKNVVATSPRLDYALDVFILLVTECLIAYLPLSIV